MQANEIRVNNWVQYKFFQKTNNPTKTIIIRERVQVLAIDSVNNKVLIKTEQFRKNHTWVSIDKINPILLTDEILIKFGFKKKDEGTICTYFFLGKNPITHDSLIDLTWIKDESGDNFEGVPFYKNGFFEIKHLHQLQNLYFSLTGKEIELTNK